MVSFTAEEIKKKQLVEKITDAFVINFMVNKLYPKIETVRGYSINQIEEKVFRGSLIYKYVHVIICIKNHTNILGIKLV
jgi:hypothetical protein